jgi:hypothetical protein
MTSDLATTFATIILVLVTCFYVYFSCKLTKKTIKFNKVDIFHSFQLFLICFSSSESLKDYH